MSDEQIDAALILLKMDKKSMKLLRLVLILTILLLAYTAVLLVMLWPWAGIALAICGMAAFGRKGIQYTAHGTARWADVSDISHMLK